MSGSFERLLDFTLDTRDRRRLRRKAVPGSKERAIQVSYEKFQRRRGRFSTEVRSLIHNAAQHANRHLATRAENCRFCESSGFSISPWYPGKSDCAPIAYDLHVNGHEVGETLVIELSRGGMVEALLWPFCLTGHQNQVTKIDLGWSPVPLCSFDTQKAEELLVLYLTAITQRWAMGQDAGPMMPNSIRQINAGSHRARGAACKSASRP